MLIMNGPSTARLNWDIINQELEDNVLQIIVTNGFLSAGKVIDSPNILYLINDPLIELLVKGEIKDLDNPETRRFLIDKFNFDDNHIEAFRYDLESCKVLKQSKYIKVAMRSKAYCKNVFSDDRVLYFDFSFLDKLLIKFSYKWHQDGSAPKVATNKYGIKTFPFESRFAKRFISNSFFSNIWYKLNFCQTPNTFYRALDLSVKSGACEIVFVGRNSQIDEWLDKEKYDAKPISIEYAYFFSEIVIKMEIKNFQSILRESYYSSQYIKMLSNIHSDKSFVSLEKCYCYKDFYSKELSGKYFL